MNGFIQFLTDNYIWFIVVTIVLLFSLIGYLVETSKYPKEPKEPNIEKEKPIKEEKSPKEPKPKKEKKKKDKKKKGQEDIIADNTPTVEEAMKMEQENNKPEEILPLDSKVETPQAPNNNGYDLPLMKDESPKEEIIDEKL